MPSTIEHEHEHLDAGWARPSREARKVHFFPYESSFSACGRWLYGGEREPSSGGRDTRRDCKECTRRALGL